MRSEPVRTGLVSGPIRSDGGPSVELGAAVLILDTEAHVRGFLQRGLARHFALVETAADIQEAEDLLRRCHFDLVIVDVCLPDRAEVDWARALRGRGSRPDVIFTAADADLDTAIAALRAGASDFLPKPFRLEEILAAATRCTQRRRPATPADGRCGGETAPPYRRDGLVGASEAMRELCAVIDRAAPLRSTVLLQGESGTGKELAARAIHTLSRRSGSFVTIDCGAVSSELLESELFGHVKGAFTGAHQAREGLIAFAQGGSLLLDEIGEMPLQLQAKLLRVLEERTIRPVGGNQEIPVDVRVVAATNRDLAEEVTAGRFRADLFYRLNVVAVRLPPLRERPEDIPVLAELFLDRLSAELGVPRPTVTAGELEALGRYAWPGNVRELRNVIERCLLLGRHPVGCIPQSPAGAGAAARGAQPDVSLQAVERRHIQKVLAAEGGNKSAAARKLGVSRKTLERKVRDWSSDE